MVKKNGDPLLNNIDIIKIVKREVFFGTNY